MVLTMRCSEPLTGCNQGEIVDAGGFVNERTTTDEAEMHLKLSFG
jgi:hypothetical protein